jgi:hypothetical protein
MNLIDLISYFRRGGTFEDFCETHALDTDSEVIEIYALEPVGLDSPLGFFPIDVTEGRTEVVSGGAKYQNLFDMFYFLDVIVEVKGIDVPNDSELAQTLLTYALNDA